MSVHQICADFTASSNLSDRAVVEDCVREIVQSHHLHILGMQSHLLRSPLDSGPGVSCMAVIAESHVAIHTWPEYNVIQLDVHSCMPLDSEAVINIVAKTFAVTECVTMRQFGRWTPQRVEAGRVYDHA